MKRRHAGTISAGLNRAIFHCRPAHGLGLGPGPKVECQVEWMCHAWRLELAQFRILLTAMPAASRLDGVHLEWEKSEVLRERMRELSRVLVPEHLHEVIRVNVQCAEVNFEALKPLASKLRDGEGPLVMFTLPDIQKETLELHDGIFRPGPSFFKAANSL